MHRLFNVLCWLWNIYDRAKLPRVYFITSTKHCMPYLALTQVFPVQVSHFATFRLGVCNFLLSHRCAHMGQMDFISSIFVRFFSKLSVKYFADHTIQMHMLISSHCLCILT